MAPLLHRAAIKIVITTSASQVTHVLRNKSSAVAEIGDRLATIDIDRKVGGCCAHFRAGELVVPI